ncbi:MAG: carboxymuconolactone decarboxylase family protein [Pseudomonadales bacterium]
MNTPTLHTTASAPENSVASLQALENNLGFIPNVFAAIAESPNALAGLMALNSNFAESSFTGEEQQVIQLATSSENECGYCMAGHTAFSCQINMPEDITNAMRNKETVPNARLQTLNSLTKALIRKKGQVTEEDTRDFYAAGFTQAQLIELIMGICVKYFTTFVSNAFQLPLDDAFKAYAWEAA